MYHFVVAIVFYLSSLLVPNIPEEIKISMWILAVIALYKGFSSSLKQKSLEFIENMENAEKTPISEAKSFIGIYMSDIQGFSPYDKESFLVAFETEEEQEVLLYTRNYSFINRMKKTEKKLKIYHNESVIVNIEELEIPK